MAEDALTLADFAAYFDALWTPGTTEDTEGTGEAKGPYRPFPWQLDLLARVDGEKRWPVLIDLPTGSGKTAVLDLAVFLLALDGERRAEDRWMPRRVALVVDRRQVVDQAEQRAATIVAKLQNAHDGVLAKVAAGLRRLSVDGEPLASTVLRGGIVRDETWAKRPDVPALISSTVDQVGSRLLFRGYGLSNSMRPIHAGLLGNDTLFILDEVHLARPFAQTLRALAGYRKPFKHHEHASPDRWQVVEMSATPSVEGTLGRGERFPDSPIDASSHPILERRLAAEKPASLIEVKVPNDSTKGNQQFAAACAKEAAKLLSGDARTIGVIVNRVDTARRIAHLLTTRPITGAHPQVVLLTGRMRSLDRDQVMDQCGHRLAIGRDRSSEVKPLVVVATQSIEAGADFDLDGIITECASFDALRQRFGRVDRDGRLTKDHKPAQSAILCRSSDAADDADDPIYGTALRSCWHWLKAQPSVDFRIGALDPDDLAPLVANQPDAPLLFPGHLDQWVQTTERPPMTDPDVSRWLHGLTASQEAAEVNVVWRADLDESLFSKAAASMERLDQQVSDRVAACPPASSEALAVPIGAFRRWARDAGPDTQMTDVPGIGAELEETQPRDRLIAARVLRWRAGRGEVISGDQVRPGDTVIVPHTRGGLTLRNWDPEATEPVHDLAQEAVARQRRRGVIRLSPNLKSFLHDHGPLDESTPEPPRWPMPDELAQVPASDRREAVLAVLRWWRDWVLDFKTGQILDHLISHGDQARAVTHAMLDGEPVQSYVITSREPLEDDWDVPTDERPGRPSRFNLSREVADLAEDDGGDAPSFTGRSAKLGNHLRSVGFWAGEMARSLGFPGWIVADLRLAGRLHDCGKADPRFQRWLHDGDELAMSMAPEPLAKSTVPDTDRARRTRARLAAGYPRGGRHELLSLDMIGSGGVPSDAAHDPDLVRHLVSSHHGHGRYRFDPIDDSEAIAVTLRVDELLLRGRTDHNLERLDSGIPETFWQLIRRYGWFDLAWMEAILRLADHKRSAAEQLGHVADDSATDDTQVNKATEDAK